MEKWRKPMRVREALSVFMGVAMVAVGVATLNAQGGSTDSPDVNEVRHYALTLAKAQQAAIAMQSINQLVAANPSLNAAMDQSANTTGKETITQQAQAIDSKYPQISAIIHADGLQTREFIVLTGAIINDVGFVGMKKQGMIPAYPPNSITPANSALIEANWDAFQALAAKMAPSNAN
jgi:hypothetical protein